MPAFLRDRLPPFGMVLIDDLPKKVFLLIKVLAFDDLALLAFGSAESVWMTQSVISNLLSAVISVSGPSV